MAFGGFKAFKVDVYGVTSGTLADVGAAIKDIADGIIATGEGWSVDTAKNPTTAYADQVSVGGEAMAVFLEHSSGARLMISMNLDQSGFDVSQIMNWDYQNPADFTGSAYGGLSMCMLQSGQDFDVANITASSFLPTEALRIVGTAQSYDYLCPKSFLYDGSTSNFMRYLIAVRGTQIIVLARRNDWSDSCFMYAIGDIFQCSNNSDTYTFGVFRPFTRGSSISENESFGSLDGQYSGYDAGGFANAEIYSSDGSLTAGKFIQGSGLANGTAVCNADLSFVKYSFSNNQRRFVPFYAYLQCLQGSGVIADDGYKGIVNPEIACAIGFTPNSGDNLNGDTILEGGKLKYIGNGICVGWDASNGALNFWS